MMEYSAYSHNQSNPHPSTLGFNFNYIEIPMHSVVPFSQCLKCLKTDITTGYFFCRKTKKSLCKYCGWTGLDWEVVESIPPHKYHMYWVERDMDSRWFNDIRVMKEEDWYGDKKLTHNVVCDCCKVAGFKKTR
jgi:hypothetical protein